MPNVCPAALRLAVGLSFFWVIGTPLRGQNQIGNPYDASSGWPFGRDMRVLDYMLGPAANEEAASISGETVSSDRLRHPLTSKARRLLLKAMHFADLGNHVAAIQGLRQAVVEVPSSAPYVANLLGLEYFEMNQYTEARQSFEEALRLMPHESANHSNLGYSLAITGDLDGAELEASKAIELDSANDKAKSLLRDLRAYKAIHHR